MEWYPVETAPTDGTRILLYRPGSYVTWAMIVIGNFDDDRYAARPKPYWTHDLERLLGKLDARKTPPTHWMPLPEAPNDETY
ncbi:hypothetical protein Lepto7375DRAFT_7248 [Leptolyngbya sp. PCC 7375]|nr:hypothetical protein Lepto7375DRAFT_7248 [Leptolyngbya sp. PCC 7375]